MSESPDGGARAPEGWYPDPAGAPIQRYWTGTEWTGRTQSFAPPDQTASASQSSSGALDRTRNASFVLWGAVLVVVLGLGLTIFGLVPQCPRNSMPFIGDQCAPQSGSNLLGEALYDIRPLSAIPKSMNVPFVGFGVLLVGLGVGGIVWSRRN